MLKGIRFLLKYCWKFSKKYIIFLLLSQIVDSIIPLIGIIMPKFIIDELMGQKRINYLIIYICILVGCTFAATILSNFLTTQYFLYKLDVFNKFQLFLGEILSKADFEQLEHPEFLNLKEKAHKFLYCNGEGFAVVLDKSAGIIGKLITLIGIISIISTLNVYIVIFFILLILLSSFIDSKAKKENIELDMKKTPYERRSMYFSTLLEDFSYGKEVRIGGIGKWLLNKYNNQIKFLKLFYNKSIKNNLKSMQMMAFTTFLQQSLAYTYLVIEVLKYSISIGNFTMYINAVNAFSGSMRDVMSSLIDIRQFKDYYESLDKYLNIEQKFRKGKNLKLPKNVTHVIEFVNVSFKYPSQERNILKNISIKLIAGQKLSIVGENGAGKTTFVKLLLRLYDPTQGKILLDGIDIKDIDYDEYMTLFSVVFQDYKLFSFSIKDNVSLSDSETVQQEKIVEALERSGLGNKLQQLEKGIETSIYKNFDETGFEPSGGEGQKIVIARALYKDSPIVILDEPTAALDPRAEYDIYKRFDELVNNKTAVYISHRLSSAKFCDIIAVFHDGEIIEYGSHDELIKLDGEYAELFNMQAEFYLD